MKKTSIGMIAVAGMALATQAAVVQWDGSSTDIASLGNVNASPGGWTADDQTWNTAYKWIAAQGAQAPVKMAMSQIQQTHKSAQINGGQDSLYLGGGGNTNQLAGGLPKVDVTAGFSQLYAFDTSLFDAADTLTNLSVTVRERATADVCSFRWFVVSGGIPYVSATNNADVGADRTTYTMADPASEVWYAFDGGTNLEAAVGASVGTLTLTNLTYAGIMTIVDEISGTQNWRGMYVYQFFAETDGVLANQVPVADAQSVLVDKNSFVDITLTGSDPEGSNLTYTVESLPTNGMLSGTAPDLTYTPDTDYEGPDSFTFTVNDGETNSEPATVSLSIVNTLPGAVWDGLGGNDFWSNPLNWVADILPVSESNVTFNTTAANENVVVDTGFTVGSGQTLLCNSGGGSLIFRIGDMGPAGELRFAAGSILDFDDQGFITESGAANQRVTFESGATLSTWRYYSNVGFTNTFIANASGEISTVHCTDDTVASLRTRGALVLDLASYTAEIGDTFVLFDYALWNTNDVFSSVTVTDAGGALVAGEDYFIDYEYDLGGGDLAVVLVIGSSGYGAWTVSYGLIGPDAEPGYDVEPDGLDNLMEYALGGNPTNDDAAAVAPDYFAANEGGTDWFYHVHNRNTDPALSFSVGATSELTLPVDTNDVEWVGATAETNGFKTVTNRTEMTSDAKFIKLEVSQ